SIPRGKILHLCKLVDTRLDAGLYPAQLVDCPWWHKLRPKGAFLQFAPPASTPAKVGRRRADGRSISQGGKSVARTDGGSHQDGYAACRRRHIPECQAQQ